MLVSMTGFCSKLITIPRGEHPIHLSITLKTLNSRYFELNAKMPYSLSFLETELHKYFKSHLLRGTVSFNIHTTDSTALTGAIAPAFSTVKGYLHAVEQIQEKFNIPGTITISDMLNFSNIFETKEAELDKTTIEELWKAIGTLTQECIAARITEGKSLEKDLLARISKMKQYLAVLEPRAAEVMLLKKKELLASFKEIESEVHEIAPETQASAVYSELQRLDVHEEIVRFGSHIENITAIITSDEIESGKKIDFTLQELFREINTITSKCADAQISNLAINIKVEIEKAREQTQNII